MFLLCILQLAKFVARTHAHFLLYRHIKRDYTLAHSCWQSWELSQFSGLLGSLFDRLCNRLKSEQARAGRVRKELNSGVQLDSLSAFFEADLRKREHVDVWPLPLEIVLNSPPQSLFFVGFHGLEQIGVR